MTGALDFATHGAQRFAGAVKESLALLRRELGNLPVGRAGVRMGCLDGLQPLLASNGSIGAIVATMLAASSRPVRAVVFDKSAAANWSLAWHQDRTICVKQRIDVDGFGPWTVKRGMHHVAPPAELLARMVTVRVHLDPVPADNAPLLVAPGSHRLGRIPLDQIEETVRRCGTSTCIAEAGDLWLYATLIVHASNAAAKPAHRRVLQIDYAAEDLPGGLEWLGV